MLTSAVFRCKLAPVIQSMDPSKPMRSLKSLLQSLALLALLALVIGALAYCFTLFFIGGAL